MRMLAMLMLLDLLQRKLQQWKLEAKLLQSVDAEKRMLGVTRLHHFATPFDPVAARAALKRTESRHFVHRVAALHALKARKKAAAHGTPPGHTRAQYNQHRRHGVFDVGP